MPMPIVNTLQILGIMAGYLGVTLLLPWILLRKGLREVPGAAMRFLAYFMAGNFYIMNLVFLLQLLHISNRLTLAAGTLLPLLVPLYRRRKEAVLRLEQMFSKVRVLLGRETGKKTLLIRMGRRMKRLSSGETGMWLAAHGPELLLILGVVLLVFYLYGSNAVRVYGYVSSDMVLHNYWINEMSRNNIFADGVYPFGMHCIFYYMHAVFGVPVYVLFRLFGVVQTLMIHLVILASLRTVCRSRYAPYAGIAAYMLTDRFYEYAYYRFYASLPQEFGMLFIFPAACFAIAFLRERNVKGRRARQYLALFAISVSMTLAVHFYGTIVTGLFCVGIAVGYAFRCFRWQYLKRIMLAGVIGLLLAVLPMAAAYAMGTPLQYSLNWGMSIITADSGENDAQDTDGAASEEGQEKSADGQGDGAGQEPAAPKQSLARRVQGVLHAVLNDVEYYVVHGRPAMARFLLGSIGALLLLGALWMLLRKYEYGAVLLSVGVFMAGLSLVQSAITLGIPQVVEVSRHAMYYAYGFAAVWSLCADAVLFLLFGERRQIDLGALGALAAVCAAVGVTGIRTPVLLSAYETNGAITCLNNILRENRDGDTWTICSANDERWMVYEYGRHYELITFLRDMADMEKDPVITIPTSTVYFFVEKVPVLYLDYINSVRPEKAVSLEGAKEPLSTAGGIYPYIEEERWVTMSHMYYWAQEFKRLYPNEMEVYYESDDFVCYRVRQDGYNLYDFAIDYGYNKAAGQEQEKVR